ncbi:MAG: EAL domain-containing protein [Clostridia bacterium]|nr:EAL domain-containing protein [Clostridia bacterium]
MNMENGEQKRDFATVEEAFASLPAPLQEQGVRTGHYAQAIFLHACAADIYPDDLKVRVRLKQELHETVFLAARLSQIGKALVPALYHEDRQDFSPEERALFQKHPSNGARLVERLLAEDYKSRPTDLNTLLEGIEGSYEHWNGEGYPAGLREQEIPIIGRIIAVARTLDQVAVRKHSEAPFDFALQQVSESSGIMLDPVVVSLVQDDRTKLKRIFNRFINQTRAIPVTPTLVSRRAFRPMALWYRPVVEIKSKKTVAYEAKMRFRDAETYTDYAAMEAKIKQEKLVDDLSVYFLAELCDTSHRLDTCAIFYQYLALTPPSGWLRKRGLDKDVAKVLEDTQTEPSRICLVVTAEQWQQRTKTQLENLARIARLGCKILFSGFGIAEISLADLQSCGATLFRISSAVGPILEDPATTSYLKELAAAGITLMAEGIEKKNHRALFHRHAITQATDQLGGDFVPEDVLVESELALQSP